MRERLPRKLRQNGSTKKVEKLEGRTRAALYIFFILVVMLDVI